MRSKKPKRKGMAQWSWRTCSLLAGDGGGGDGSLWVQEKGAYSFYDLPEGFDEESQRREDFRTGGGSVDSLRQLDRNGGEIQRVELGGSQGFSMDRDGIRYVLVQEELRVLNSEWELLFAI